MRWSWLASLALVTSGCGLGEYEAQMREAQVRLQRHEQENRLLDARIQPPRKGESHIANVYFRPPKGISDTAVNEQEPLGGILYRYEPRTTGGAGPFAQVELAFGDNRKEFTDGVLDQYSMPRNLTPKQLSVQQPGQPAQAFQNYERDDGQYFYSVYIWRGEKKQAAIVFKISQASRGSQALNDVIRASLATFALDTEANLRRTEADRGSPLQAVGNRP